jgi:hypothetical protein
MRRIQIGDLVRYKENPRVWKTHKSALEVAKYIADLDNPHYVISDGDNIPPELSQEYIVLDTKDLFDRRGYHKRYVKIAGWLNENNPVEGWLPEESLNVTVEG